MVLFLFFVFSISVAYGAGKLKEYKTGSSYHDLQSSMAHIAGRNGLYQGSFEESAPDGWLFSIHSDESKKGLELGESVVVKVYARSGTVLFRSVVVRKIDLPPFYLLKKPTQKFFPAEK